MDRLLLTSLSVASLGIGAMRSAGAQDVDRSTSLEAVIAAERAFAAMAKTHGIDTAFYESIADDGVLFRPRVVPGKQWLRQNMRPKGPDLLAWDPRWADVSAAGDLGYTTGPYEYRPDARSDSIAGRGTFITVWKRGADGRWRYALDLGSQGSPSGPVAGVTDVRSPSPAPAQASWGSGDQLAGLIAFDQRVGTYPIAPTERPAILAHLGPDSRVYRLGQAPAIGPDAAAMLLGADPGQLTSTPLAGGVARSGDLGYTYGTYEFSPASAPATPRQGNYLRIWRRAPSGAWTLVLDLLSPVRVRPGNG
jgi:ketosteroid isomerase-like protein